MGPLVLNPNVVITPVDVLPETLRNNLGGLGNDRIVSHKGSRSRSLRIGQEAAAFIEKFRRPVTFVEAILAHCSDSEADPERILEAVYPLVASFRSEGLLVDPADATVRLNAKLFLDGATVQGVTILECVRALADTEVYKGVRSDGTLVALKFLRSDAPHFVLEAFEHERCVLRYLSGKGIPGIPKLLSDGVAEAGVFMVLEWCEGRTADEVAFGKHIDRRGRSMVARNFLRLCCDLHAAGVWHGDVQPRNVIVTATNDVFLLDYGGATLVGTTPAPCRVGMLPYYEPELAITFVHGRSPATVTAKGEQYNIAALVYAILTGSSCLPLALETDVALKQIIEQAPRTMQEVGIHWMSLEEVLHRALSKDPDQRFGSLGEFACRLCEILDEADSGVASFGTPSARALVADPDRTHREPHVEDCSRHIVDRYGLRSITIRNGLSKGPRASLYYGAAGIAYALFRLSILEQNAELLAAADVWITRAICDRHEQKAFFDDEVGMKRGMSGPYSLFNSSTGLFLLNAWIRHSSNDQAGRDRSIRCFVEELRASPERIGHPLDLMNGSVGLLLGCALLLPICISETVRKELLSVGAEVEARVRAEVEEAFTPPFGPNNPYLGLAHGRAGALFSLLQWSEACQRSMDERIAFHLEQLLALSSVTDAGRSWPVEHSRPSSRWTGWCHGSAGHILLWSAAWRSSLNEAYLNTAVQAAEYLWNARAGSGSSLCCGLSGAAMSFAQLADITSNNEWRRRGAVLIRLALSANRPSETPDSLFRGELGVWLAAVELSNTRSSVWPLCGFPC